MKQKTVKRNTEQQTDGMIGKKLLKGVARGEGVVEGQRNGEKRDGAREGWDKGKVRSVKRTGQTSKGGMDRRTDRAKDGERRKRQDE